LNKEGGLGIINLNIEGGLGIRNFNRGEHGNKEIQEGRGLQMMNSKREESLGINHLSTAKCLGIKNLRQDGGLGVRNLNKEGSLGIRI
jgi:hypothetical protein